MLHAKHYVWRTSQTPHQPDHIISTDQCFPSVWTGNLVRGERRRMDRTQSKPLRKPRRGSRSPPSSRTAMFLCCWFVSENLISIYGSFGCHVTYLGKVEENEHLWQLFMWIALPVTVVVSVNKNHLKEGGTAPSQTLPAATIMNTNHWSS